MVGRVPPAAAPTIRRVGTRQSSRGDPRAPQEAAAPDGPLTAEGDRAPSSGAVRWSLAGEAAGLGIALLTVAAERSGLVFGPYSLAGNGALVVPGVLVPLALYGGWSVLLRQGASMAPRVSYAVGLAVGVGLAALFLAAAAGADFGAEIALAILGNGLIFTAPPAGLAALAIYAYGPGRIPATPLWLSAGIGLVMLVSLVPPFATLGGFGANGLLAGIQTVAATRVGSWGAVVALGAGLLVLLLVLAFGVPLLVLA